MIEDYRSIDSLPFSEELKGKLKRAFIGRPEGGPNRGNCALIGCPKTIAAGILGAAASDMGCGLIIKDFLRAADKQEGELASLIGNAKENDIIAFFNVHAIDPKSFLLLRDALIKGEIHVTVGKGPLAQTVDIPIPANRMILVADDKGDIPFDLMEGIFATVDLSPYRKELRQEIILSTFEKYGLSVEEHVAEMIEGSSYSEQAMLARLFEIRNAAYEKGLTVITEQLVNEAKTDASDLESVDQMDGRQFELFTGDLFRALGYTDVNVTPASGDFGADVIAEKDGVRYAIQCKRYDAPVGVAAVQEVMASRSLHDCHVACVLTNRTFTPAAVELAKKNYVVLWDRVKLRDFILRRNRINPLTSEENSI